jgi:hypothetical protein
MPKRKTFDAVADPQSQNVHWNGQPRFVSHVMTQPMSGLSAMSRSNTPVRYGDGSSSRSVIRSRRGVETTRPSASTKLTDCTDAQSRVAAASRMSVNVRSPSPWQTTSTSGWRSRNGSTSSGTCGPPSTMITSGSTARSARTMAIDSSMFHT